MSGAYRFTFQQDEHADHRVDALKYDSEALEQPDHVFPAIYVEVVVPDTDADLTSLVAAFRAVLRASGFSEDQAAQIVVTPYNKAE